jgi:predicted nucleic acid-binding protein
MDNSAWIEFLIGSGLGVRLVKRFPAADAVIMPSVVQLELAKWLTREKGEDAANTLIASSTTCVVTPLTTDLALCAATHKLTAVDDIFYATALASGATLLTCDAHSEELTEEELVGKG